MGSFIQDEPKKTKKKPASTKPVKKSEPQIKEESGQTDRYEVTGSPSDQAGICRIAGLGNTANDVINRPADLIVLKSSLVFFGVQVKRPGPVAIGFMIDNTVYPFRMHVPVVEVTLEQSDKIEPLAFEYPHDLVQPGTIHQVTFFVGELTDTGPVWFSESQPFTIEIT